MAVFAASINGIMGRQSVSPTQNVDRHVSTNNRIGMRSRRRGGAYASSVTGVDSLYFADSREFGLGSGGESVVTDFHKTISARQISSTVAGRSHRDRRNPSSIDFSSLTSAYQSVHFYARSLKTTEAPKPMVNQPAGTTH